MSDSKAAPTTFAAPDDPADDQSSQSGSSTSAAVGVDPSVMKLASDPVNKLIWTNSLATMAGTVLQAALAIIEYNYITTFAGTFAQAMEVVYAPLINCFCMYFPASFGAATSNFISRALAQGQASVANVYLSHFFFVALVWSVLVPIAFVSWYQIAGSALGHITTGSGLNTPVISSQMYYALMMGLMPLCYTFSSAVAPFLRVENRSFLGMFRQIVICVLQLMVMGLSYYISSMSGGVGGADETGLEYVAVAHIVANLVVGIWMLFIFLRKSILNVPLKGCLKFSTKRLFPLNIRIIGRILLFGLSQWFSLAQVQICVIVMNLLYGYLYTDQDSINTKRLGYACYARLYALLNSMSSAFTTGFSSVVGFNLALKKFKRVKKTILFTFMWMSVCTLVLCIVFLLCGSFVVTALQPKLDMPAEEYDLMISDIVSMSRLAVYTPFLMAGYTLSCTLTQMEGKAGMLVLIQLSRTVPTLVILIILATVNGDQADFTLAFPIGDGCGAFVGVIIFIQYVFKYKYLEGLEVPDAPEDPAAQPGDEDEVAYQDGQAASGDAEYGYGSDEHGESSSPNRQIRNFDSQVLDKDSEGRPMDAAGNDFSQSLDFMESTFDGGVSDMDGGTGLADSEAKPSGDE